MWSNTTDRIIRWDNHLEDWWYLLNLDMSIFYVPALVFYPTEICRVFSKRNDLEMFIAV